MSLNIRFDNPSDGEDRWELRRDELCELLKTNNLDFIGIQEALPGQVEFIDGQLTEHGYIGFGRDGRGTESESVPLFYKRSVYELLHSEVFWLSETPAVPSKGWDAALNRITTYGAFRNMKTQDTIHVFNTHFDHRGERARIKSSELLLKKIQNLDLMDKMVVVLGDLNSEPRDLPIRILANELKDAFNNARQAPSGPVGTFNGFDIRSQPKGRIDYIFCRNLEILKYSALETRRKNNRWISDHLPVMAELTN
jgi:endonuclease/exonuclease/phosphatase family metal-dependent hydrolase